ncbi:MAG: M3 family metallopeptidase [Candidatus Krumholzibacteriota bacterium]|nr:M3 family metallopeptidase [Candidatus Krumholzibacteriota bacterium]
MKKRALLLFIIAIVVFSCSLGTQNPFFSEFETPFGVPPFDKIQEKHYMPAFKKGIEQHEDEIETIAENSENATFNNTLEEMENSGILLGKVSNVFFGLNSSNTNEEMQEIAKEVTPMLSEHRDNIIMNGKLFKRIKSVYEQREKLDLTDEQHMLLKKYYKEFVRGGADLPEEKKQKLRKINKEISIQSLRFGENLLKEVNKFELLIEEKDDLEGLPEGVISTASEDASEKGYEGKWLFTLNKPSMLPFLKHSKKRELREKIYKAYLNKGNHGGKLDNKNIVNKLCNLRLQKANLLGYETHADLVLEKNMAEAPGAVYRLLDQLWRPSLDLAKEEAAAMQKMIDDEGEDFKLKSWDWWYYAEKIRKQRYDLDEEMLKPYFKLENVRDGAFEVAGRLYGITFEERYDIPKYHKDVKVFEVKEQDGSHIGILYVDYFPRESKRGGAWMGAYRSQSYRNGEKVTPVIVNVGNFSKPTAGKPSLLSWDNVLTLFHEFGHGLHGLLADCHYEKLSGTSVARDFVELPSQIMENWAKEPEVLKMYARHYKTGEAIPDELIAKIQKTSKFNQGFALTEYLAASLLDMDWHTVTKEKDFDVLEFEKKSLDRINLIPQIAPRYRSTYFRHIFSGGYSSGYYSYIWAEVLDADGFQAFKEKGLFDQETAGAFRKNVLAKGGSVKPMTLYKRFRGKEPSIEPLLKKRGLE